MNVIQSRVQQENRLQDQTVVFQSLVTHEHDLLELRIEVEALKADQRSSLPAGASRRPSGPGTGSHPLFVVGAHEDDADNPQSLRGPTVGYLPGHHDVASEGFSQFVANREGETFLRA